jgi:predicted ATPase
VLATSREPLGVEGEAVWQVPVLEAAEARQLFAERALLVAPHFELAHAESDVDAVCARVDHLPLGIELAAAWSRALGPAQIASGLDDSIRLLTGGPRTAVPRHQTLSASIRWSHALLDPQEKVLFRRLAAFAGTFGVEAVSVVAADPDDRQRDRADWLHLLGRLLDKSLVVARDVGGEVRYRLLDTIRQYAEQ